MNKKVIFVKCMLVGIFGISVFQFAPLVDSSFLAGLDLKAKTGIKNMLYIIGWESFLYMIVRLKELTNMDNNNG